MSVWDLQVLGGGSLLNFHQQQALTYASMLHQQLHKLADGAATIQIVTAQDTGHVIIGELGSQISHMSVGSSEIENYIYNHSSLQTGELYNSLDKARQLRHKLAGETFFLASYGQHNDYKPNDVYNIYMLSQALQRHLVLSAENYGTSLDFHVAAYTVAMTSCMKSIYSNLKHKLFVH